MNFKSDSDSEFEDAVDSLPISPQSKFLSMSFSAQRIPSSQNDSASNLSLSSNISFPSMMNMENKHHSSFFSPSNGGNCSFINVPSTSSQVVNFVLLLKLFNCLG